MYQKKKSIAIHHELENQIDGLHEAMHISKCMQVDSQLQHHGGHKGTR